MQPEDIDKLFRDRLAHHAPTPPAYLWNQLEDELQPAKKRPVLWMWAAAASVALLLVSGVLWLQFGAGQPIGSGAVATAARPAHRSAQPAARLESRPENKLVAAAAAQATPPRPLPSTPITAATSVPSVRRGQPAAARQLASATGKASPSKRAATANRSATSPKALTSPLASEAIATLAPKTQPERISEPTETTPEPQPLPALAALAAPAVPAGPIEVEVRRSTSAAVATAAPAARQHSLGGILLRQARNVVRGDRVSLAQAGLPETVTVQAHVAGRTLTKVIQL
jgi:hypothetical protein